MGTDEVIDVWLSIGSTYAYLTVMRLADVERAAGVRFRWRPFNVRAIMRDMDNIPFATKPVKAAYMWRDIERRAAMYGFPAQVPAPYPLQAFDVANRVAVLGAQEGWCADYARATYRRWFQQGLAAGSEPNLSESLREIGQDPQRVITQAAGDAIGRAYDAPGYLAAHGRPVRPADLTRHNCLGYTYWALRGEWRFVGPEGPVSVRISGTMEANNGEALRAAALRGQGIILQPSFIVGDDLAAGRLEPLLSDYRAAELAIFGVYPSGRHLSAKVRSFLDFLIARFGERPYWDAWIG